MSGDANHVYVVAEELVRLSGTTLDASVGIAEDWGGSLASLAVPDTAPGNTATGPSLAAAAGRAAEAADAAIARIVGQLQDDADALLAVAFDVTTTDEDVAARLAGESEPRRSGAA